MDAPTVQRDVLERGRAEYLTLIVLTGLGVFLAVPYRTGLIPALLCALTFRAVGRPTRYAFAVLCVAIMVVSFFAESR